MTFLFSVFFILTIQFGVVAHEFADTLAADACTPSAGLATPPSATPIRDQQSDDAENDEEEDDEDEDEEPDCE